MVHIEAGAFFLHTISIQLIFFYVSSLDYNQSWELKTTTSDNLNEIENVRIIGLNLKFLNSFIYISKVNDSENILCPICGNRELIFPFHVSF